MARYFWNLLIALDQFVNVILGGYPDETISSRMGKRARKGDPLGKVVCGALDVIDKRHCEKSIEEDEGNRQLRDHNKGVD